MALLALLLPAGTRAHPLPNTPIHAVKNVREFGSNTGRLSSVDRNYDPYTGIPMMSAIPVNVRPG